MNTIGKQARLGLYFLKEAVSEVLFNARDKGPLQLEEIRKRLDISKLNEPPDRSNNLILSIIFLLQSEGRVQLISKNRCGWKITQTEVLRQKSYQSIKAFHLR